MPYYYQEVLWIIAPLIFALIMLQMYFGKYKTEPLGWNTAFGNTISLMWVTVMMVRYAQTNYGLGAMVANPSLRGYSVIILILGMITITLAFINFHHLLPKKFAFIISSSLPVNGIAYFTVVIVMGGIVLDTITLMAVIVLFLFLAALFYFYRKIITPPKSAIPTLKKHEEEKRRFKQKIKRKIKKVFVKDEKLGKNKKKKTSNKDKKPETKPSYL